MTHRHEMMDCPTTAAAAAEVRLVPTTTTSMTMNQRKGVQSPARKRRMKTTTRTTTLPISFLYNISFLIIFTAILFLGSVVHGQEQDEPTTTTTCTFEDGMVYELGEDVGNSFSTRCGDTTEYPCYCNPTLTFQVYCPYCGFVNGDGTLFCSKDGDTITFPDGMITRECSCTFPPNDESADPIRNCTIQNDSSSGDDDDDDDDDQVNSNPNEGPSGPPMSSGGGDDDDDDGTTTTNTCILPDADNTLIEFENGESFGDLIEGACGPASEWPSFCVAVEEGGGDNNFEIGYPYCVFNDAESGETLCAQDGDSISYVNVDGDTVKCNCEYTTEGGSNPDCQNITDDPLPSNPENEADEEEEEREEEKDSSVNDNSNSVPTGAPNTDRTGTPESAVTPGESTPSTAPGPSSSGSLLPGRTYTNIRRHRQGLLLPWLILLIRTFLL
jgi:hypothetical protein